MHFLQHLTTEDRQLEITDYHYGPKTKLKMSSFARVEKGVARRRLEAIIVDLNVEVKKMIESTTCTNRKGAYKKMIEKWPSKVKENWIYLPKTRNPVKVPHTHEDSEKFLSTETDVGPSQSEDLIQASQSCGAFTFKKPSLDGAAGPRPCTSGEVSILILYYK